jgi:hypothetical protein
MFLTAFAIFGILGTVYSVNQSRQLEKEVAELRNNLQTTPTAIPTQPPEQISIDDWQSYTNENYSFSFRYPEKWAVRQPTAEEGNLIEYIDSDRTAEIDGQEVEYYLWLESAETLPDNDYTQTLVNHYPAFKNDQKPSRYGALTYLVRKSDDQYISISLTPYNDENPFSNQNNIIPIFEKMLSTFQYTDQEAKIITQGTLQSLERPAPDIPYDYQIQLSKPYYDELNAMKAGYVDDFVLVSNNESITQKLSSLVGESVTIEGNIEWGLAETRHLRVTNIVSN